MAEQIVDRGEPTGELIREALDETRELVRLEVALAREEVREEIARAKTAGIAFGVAAAFGISGLTMLLVAIAMAFSMEWLAALVLGAIALCLAAVAGLGGYRARPQKPLAQTKERLESDLKQLKERIA